MFTLFYMKWICSWRLRKTFGVFTVPFYHRPPIPLSPLPLPSCHRLKWLTEHRRLDREESFIASVSTVLLLFPAASLDPCQCCCCCCCRCRCRCRCSEFCCCRRRRCWCYTTRLESSLAKVNLRYSFVFFSGFLSYCGEASKDDRTHLDLN